MEPGKTAVPVPSTEATLHEPEEPRNGVVPKLLLQLEHTTCVATDRGTYAARLVEGAKESCTTGIKVVNLIVCSRTRSPVGTHMHSQYTYAVSFHPIAAALKSVKLNRSCAPPMLEEAMVADERERAEDEKDTILSLVDRLEDRCIKASHRIWPTEGTAFG
jgi:hypothetical protein